MRGLPYHQSLFDLLDAQPPVSAQAREMIEAYERRRGQRLPEAVRQWYLLRDVVPLTLEALQSGRGYRRAHTLELAHAAYHASWYVPAIREMAAAEGFRADPHWIARRLLPPISVSEASRALEIGGILFE